MTEIERIDQLREELHRHNYNYYVLNAPEITDQEFDKLMRELQDLAVLRVVAADPDEALMIDRNTVLVGEPVIAFAGPAPRFQ